jgi:hypothetical protein
VTVAMRRRVGAADHPAAPLLRVRGFVREVAQASWFAACGEALTPGERGDAAAYLAALGLEAAAIEGVAGWTDAAATTQRPDWSQRWWETEERERRALYESAAAKSGEAALLAALSAVTQAASDLVHGAAAVAASRAGVADPALHRVAAGAAAQACYHAALALAAGHGDAHGFAVKFRLFAAGRWPLGIVGARFFVF